MEEDLRGKSNQISKLDATIKSVSDEVLKVLTAVWNWRNFGSKEKFLLSTISSIFIPRQTVLPFGKRSRFGKRNSRYDVLYSSKFYAIIKQLK